MDEIIELNQRNIILNKNDILNILDFKNEDVIFLSGSLVEGNINNLSKGMGNKYSDIDIFILTDDLQNISRSTIDYDEPYLKTQFKKIYGISVDIEIYSKNLINDLIIQLNNLDFSLINVRTLNLLKLPDSFNLKNFTSFIHRLLNSIPIFNEDELNKIKTTLNQDNYFKMMTRLSINYIDSIYEDVIGNLENNELETALAISRDILLQSIKVYIFYMKTSIDRDKWIPIKIKNLSKLDYQSKHFYEKFIELYFKTKLDDKQSFKSNIEKILQLSNEIISLIGDTEGV